MQNVAKALTGLAFTCAICVAQGAVYAQGCVASPRRRTGHTYRPFLSLRQVNATG